MAWFGWALAAMPPLSSPIVLQPDSMTASSNAAADTPPRFKSIMTCSVPRAQ